MLENKIKCFILDSWLKFDDHMEGDENITTKTWNAVK